MNLRSRKSEKNKETLRRLTQKDGNRFCFDCATRGPLYVVTNYHILVCSTCSAAHRSFQHKVKGISMSEFTDEEMAGAILCGNDRAAKIWLATFKGDRPRPGHDRSIFSFVEAVFERGAYKNVSELRALEEDIHAEMTPELRKSVPGSTSLAAVPQPQPQPQPQPPPSKQEEQLPPAPPPPPSATQQKQHDIFDDIFGAPVAAPSSCQQQQPPSQPWSSQPSPPQPEGHFPSSGQPQWGAPPPPQEQRWGGPSSAASNGVPDPSLQQPPQSWGAFGGNAQQPSSPPPSQQQQQLRPSGPTSPSGGRIRILGVTSNTTGTTASHPQVGPTVGPAQQPAPQPQEQWGAPRNTDNNTSAFLSQPSPQPWGASQQPPPQQWAQPPQQPPPQQWAQPPPQQPPWGAPPPPQTWGQQHYSPPSNHNHYTSASTHNAGFFQAPQADSWGSGAPSLTLQPQQPETHKTAYDTNAFAGLNPF